MRRIADVNCLFFRDASLAAFADSYCNKIEIVHAAGVPGADAHCISAVVSCAHGTGGRDLSSTGGLHSFVMDHLLMLHEQKEVSEIVGILDGIVQVRFEHGAEGRLALFLTQPLRIADGFLFIIFQNDAQTMRFAQPV